MKRSVLCLVALLALLFTAMADAKTGQASRDNTTVTPQEYVVYSVVLANRLVRAQATLLVVANRTVQAKHFDDEIARPREDSFGKRFVGLAPETVDDYLSKNESDAQIEHQLTVPVNYSLVSEPELKSFFQKGPSGWAGFYAKYPDSTGVIRFSRVGFNGARDQAFLYVSQACGPLCGRGNYVFLIKNNGGWQIQKELMLWVS